jgi:hypothetical protein
VSGESGGPAGGSAGDAGSSGGGGDSGSAGASACPVGCEASGDDTVCGDNEVHWNCFGTTDDPTPDERELFRDNCTSRATPLPTYCCPASFLSGC